MICECCGKEHDGSFGSGRFCSRACANKRIHTDETKRKIAQSVKENPSGVVLLQQEGHITQKMAKARERSRATLENGHLQKAICPVCNKEFVYRSWAHRKYCSKECWNKVSGGFREGSVKNHVHGVYNSFRYDSSWELIYIKWALKNNILFKRNTIGFPYIWKGETHQYYPDFYLPNTDEYIEIKGIVDEFWEAKKAAFPYKLTVLTKKEIKAIEKEL